MSRAGCVLPVGKDPSAQNLCPSLEMNKTPPTAQCRRGAGRGEHAVSGTAQAWGVNVQSHGTSVLGNYRATVADPSRVGVCSLLKSPSGRCCLRWESWPWRVPASSLGLLLVRLSSARVLCSGTAERPPRRPPWSQTRKPAAYSEGGQSQHGPRK